MKVMVIQGHVLELSGPAHLVENAVSMFGGLGVLIENADELVRRQPMVEMVDDFMQEVRLLAPVEPADRWLASMLSMKGSSHARRNHE